MGPEKKAELLSGRCEVIRMVTQHLYFGFDLCFGDIPRLRPFIKISRDESATQVNAGPRKLVNTEALHVYAVILTFIA